MVVDNYLAAAVDSCLVVASLSVQLILVAVLGLDLEALNLKVVSVWTC